MKRAQHTFDGGLNTDINARALAPNQYIAAENIALTNNGAFRTVAPIKGSITLDTLGVYTDIKILGLFDTIYLYDGSPKACVTMVAILDSHYVIWACPSEGSNAVKLYDETITNPDDYTAATGEVFSENGVDTLYYTDGVNQPRQLRCVIPNSASFTLLSKTELSLIKRAPLGTSITDFTITSTGGTLLCGSYQACIRLYNSSTNRYSAWTLPTNPIIIHHVSTTELPNSARGSATTKYITFDLAFTNATEKALYTHYQIGVIENTSSDTPVQNISVLPVEALPVGSTTTFDYKQNQRTVSNTIDEVVIEPAPVQTAKTLAIKDNRLFLGNITYKGLELDNGTPVIGATSSIQTFSPSPLTTARNWYSDDDLASRYVGHFRDEVYRYAISYWDENYNFSPPSILDMDVVDNAILAGTHRDMKFPARNVAGYELFDTGVPQALGLTLRNLTNHPSWAKGFVILRAKRQKNILFQTPFIPAGKVEPTSAYEDFPTDALQSVPSTSGSRTRTTVTFADAQPGINTLGTYTPKSLLQGLTYWIKRRTSAFTSSNQIIGGARYSQETASVTVANIFPVGDMFQTPTGAKISSYTHTTGDKFKTVDLAHLKCNISDNSDNDLAFDLGDFVNTQMESILYADTSDCYYTVSGSGFTLNTSTTISDYVFVNDFDSGKVLDSGESVEQYDGVLPTGFVDGFKPTTLRKGYIVPLFPASDVVASMYDAARVGIGGIGVVSAGTVFINGGRLESDYILGGTGGSQGFGNKLVVEAAGFVAGNKIQGIKIVNVERGLGDDRYGDVDAYHEFVYTGTNYEFTSGEIASLEAGGNITTNAAGIDVWGGDCYITYAQYKVADTAFSIDDDELATNNVQQINNDVADKFTYWFKASTGVPDKAHTRPVPLKALSQIVSLFIESEYNLDIQTRNSLYNNGLTTNDVTKASATSKDYYRLPFTYVIQPELSFRNEYKVWIPKLTDIESPTQYKSRILISDQKIYQSDVKGFDTFKALGFYDLDETNGSITRLLVSDNRMNAIQENAIVYVPVNVNQIETADGVTLSITTDSVIGKPVYITNKYGAQKLPAIVQADVGYYIVDQRRGKVLYIVGDSIQPVSEKGLLRTLEDTLLVNNTIKLYYSMKERQLFLAIETGFTSTRYMFDAVLGLWVTSLPLNASRTDAFLGAISSLGSHGTFMVFGKEVALGTNQFTYVKWGTTPTNDHLNVTMVPNITFIMNPDSGAPKIFDDLNIDSDNLLGNATCYVIRDTSLGQQTAGPVALTLDRYEGNYSFAILRDSNDERLRGNYLKVLLTWPTTLLTVDNYKLASVLLKYRISKSPY